MSQITLTLFNGQGNTKIPFSVYEDGSFIFANKNFSLLKDAYEYIVKNYSLSRHLNLKEPVKLHRDRKALESYIPNYINSLVITLTEIKDIYAVEDVIEYFKNKNISCVIGRGSQYDGQNTFHLQAILRVKFEPNENTIKNTLKILQSELKDLCKVDLYSSSILSVQAPTNNTKILYLKERGKILKNSELSPVLNSNNNSKHLNISYNDDFVELCLEQFYLLGFQPSSTKTKGKAISFYREYDTSVKEGYFWFMDKPLVMNHKNKKDSVSIYHFMKHTKEGKEWLKNKTKEEQAYQLIRKDNLKDYTRYLDCEERYLDFSKLNKIKLVDEFISSNNGVLKLKSPMGTGKSSGIELIIKKAHKRKEKVIIVSNRISVAKDFSEKYGLLLYQDPDSVTSKESIVVQYDSLHKYDLSKYDIAIFDEYISLLLHHRSNLNSNSNINAVKFKILSETKRVVIADAFLTGYDSVFFENREKFYIENKYKDDVKLYDYKFKETFITNLINRTKDLKEGEHISASFTSLNMIKLVEYELKQKGVKVISLTSETAELTKELIYKKFQENTHNSFQVILFTPTLTVGVSNINNIVSHWHYDSAMGADVISSLQMIKRSRTAKEIHFFIQSRQNHFDTNLESININAQRNIAKYYNNKDKTLLVDIDYATGDMVLTELAKYINKIEVFYNILANNHSNAFRLLLAYQFKNLPVLIDKDNKNYNVKEKIQGIKNKIRTQNLKILDEYSSVDWTEEELNYIKHKISHKSEEEQAILMMGSIQEKFKKTIPKKKLLELTKMEMESGNKFISFIKNTHLTIKSNSEDYTKYELSTAISSDISSLQNKNHIRFLENLLKFSGNLLDTSYSKNDINRINQEIFEGKRKFAKFLSDMGYIYNKHSKKYEADVRVYSYIEYI